MTFKREKVLDGLTDGAARYTGWTGYVADDVVTLKERVTHGDAEHNMRLAEVTEDGMFKSELGTKYALFYPALAPDSLIRRLYDMHKDRPCYLLEKSTKWLSIVMSWDFDNNEALVCNSWNDADSLCQYYTLPDGTELSTFATDGEAEKEDVHG